MKTEKVEQPPATDDKQEWAKAYGPSDNCVQIDGLVFEVTMSAQVITDKINAALKSEREKRINQTAQLNAEHNLVCQQLLQAEEKLKQYESDKS